MTRFVITSAGRDGSTMLVSMLDQHPQIKCEWELLGWEHWKSKQDRYARQLDLIRDFFEQPCPPAVRALGFKLIVHQGRLGHQHEIREYLRSLGVSVIHIRRRNLLCKYCSHLIAKQTGRWQISSPDQQSCQTVKIDPTEAMAYFRCSLEDYRRNEAEFAKCRSLTICYEQLSADAETIMQRVFALLGVPDVNAGEKVRRVTGRRDCAAPF